MFSTWKKALAVLVFAGLLAIAAPLKTAIAGGQSSTAPAPVAAPAAPMVAAGTPEAVQLLKLMDTDKSGKISHAEYMAFMEAEFQRLDLDHDGELNLKELEHSQLAVAHHGGTRR
jgi:hypothetical protein